MSKYILSLDKKKLLHFIWTGTKIEGLTSLDISSEILIKIIGNKSFAYDSSLQIICLSSKLETIEEYAFEKCYELQIVQFLKTTKGKEEEIKNTGIKGRNNKPLILQYRCFKDCQKLHTVDLSFAKNVRIEAEAFVGCNLLRTILLPEVCEISESAFDGCDKDVLSFGIKQGSKAEQYAREHEFRYFEI